MSIATAISALQSASSDIASAIAAKGVTVPSGSGFGDYANLIGQISGGGSSGPYTPVEYLQTNGSQYFTLTDRTYSESSAAFYVDFQQTTNVNQARLVGPTASSTTTEHIYINGSGVIAYCFNNSWASTGVTAGTTRHTVKLDYKNKKVTVDGTDITLSDSSTRSVTSLGFAHKYGSNATFIGKIYAIKIWVNNTLLHDFIPVRVQNVGHFYDNVTGYLIANQGTGNWTLGPDITEA